MITKEYFTTLKNSISFEIRKFMGNVLEENPTNYVMFLSNCRFDPALENNLLGISPYTIDNYKDVFADESRYKFLVDYLQLYYSFPDGEKISVNEEQAIHIELMIYTHTWESRPFLRRLLAFSQLLTEKAYTWNPIAPESNLPSFITQIIKSFKNSESELASIINSGYNKQLRNAFAHSEYDIDSRMKKLRINLHNYKGKPKQTQEFFIDEWKIWFVNSVLFSYLFQYETNNLRRTIISDLGTNIFEIPFPNKKGAPQKTLIIYNEEKDKFSFV